MTESGLPPSSAPPSGGGEGEDLPSLTPSEELFAAHLAGMDASAASELPSGDPAALARLFALHEIAERGLDALAQRGAPEILDQVTSGRRIGDYRLLEEIGSGGMGVLYLARDEVLGRLVAVKLLTRMGASTEQRFRREAEIVASLDHPHIVDVFARGVEDGVQYIAMRYIAGADIDRAWRATSESADGSRTRRLDRLVAWIGDVARALHYAHEQGVLHRDVKPGNILVEDDHVYVVDFGLATHAGGLELTRTGDRLGTLPYMPPEQIRGDHAQLDRRADIYGLGVTLYQLLADSLPFTATNPEALARQILRRDPPSLTALGVPRDLEAVVMKALEKEPDRRYATARELGEDLDRFLLREPVRARRLGPLRRSFRFVARRPVASLTAVLLLLGLGVALIALGRARDARLRADTARYERALADAARGDHAAAVGALQALEDEGASIPGLPQSRLRNRVLQLHDDLMRLVFIPRESPLSDYPVARTVADAHEMLAELESLDARGLVAATYRDRLRLIEIVVKRRRGHRAEALALIDSWEAELGGATRLTVCARALATMGEGSESDEASLADRIAALPLRDPDDHYHAALAASRIAGAEAFGLEEIDRYLQGQPGDYWGRHTKGNLLRRLRRWREAREVYSGLIASMSVGRAGLARASRAAESRAAGGEEEALAASRSPSEKLAASRIPSEKLAASRSPSEKLAASRVPSEKLAASHWQRGLVTARLGRFAEARLDFRRAERAVRPWALALALAACDRGEGRAAEALRGYRRALAQLDERLGQDRNDAMLRRGRRERRDIVKAIVRCQVDLGRHDEAEHDLALFASTPASPDGTRESKREAEILRAAVRADRLRRRREGVALGPSEVEALEDLARELEALVVHAEPHRDLDLLRAECAWVLQERDLCEEILAPHLAVSDPEVLYYRAAWRFEAVAALRDQLFDRRLPADASSELREAWDRIQAQLRDDIRTAVDDLGVLREGGFASLAEVQDPALIAYLYGTLRLWQEEARSALAILRPLLETRAFSTPGPRALLLGQIARAEREVGDFDASWLRFREALALVPSDARALVEMGRVAARAGDVDRAVEALTMMRKQQAEADYPAKELRAPVWETLRQHPRLRPFLETK
jgi:tetratricopeptide (TPR) repeat protein/predicted Ser/Thr protein kinase